MNHHVHRGYGRESELSVTRVWSFTCRLCVQRTVHVRYDLYVNGHVHTRLSFVNDHSFFRECFCLQTDIKNFSYLYLTEYSFDLDKNWDSDRLKHGLQTDVRHGFGQNTMYIVYDSWETVSVSEWISEAVNQWTKHVLRTQPLQVCELKKYATISKNLRQSMCLYLIKSHTVLYPKKTCVLFNKSRCFDERKRKQARYMFD